jgi:hypothetical protein
MALIDVCTVMRGLVSRADHARRQPEPCRATTSVILR